MAWHFGRMSDVFLIEGSSGIRIMGQREYLSPCTGSEQQKTPCSFKSAMSELLLLTLMSFGEKLLSLANFSRRQKSLRSPKSFYIFVAWQKRLGLSTVRGTVLVLVLYWWSVERAWLKCWNVEIIRLLLQYLSSCTMSTTSTTRIHRYAYCMYILCWYRFLLQLWVQLRREVVIHAVHMHLIPEKGWSDNASRQ
jgi:hypothetical protein